MEILTILRWRIDNFSTIAARDDPEEFLTGPTFKLQNGSVVCLGFYPTHILPDGSKDYSSVFLGLMDLAGKNSVTLKYRLWIENTDGEKFGENSKVIHNDFKEIGEICGCPIHHSQLYSPTDFVKDDVVYMCCEIQNDSSVEKVASPSYDSILREKFYSFYKEDSADKCVLKVQDKEFKVSKPFLIAHSDYFERMFSANMLENKTNTVVIEDVRPEVMGAFIEYLYLQKLDNFDVFAQELFFLADKYSFDNLKNECVQSMSKTFSKENALKQLKLAFMHNNDDLKKQALKYVCNKTSDGNFRSILKTEEWTQLMIENIELATEIMDAAFDQIKLM